MVGSSIGYLLEKSARLWCQMGSRARPPVPILDLGGVRYGRFGGSISVWVSNYVCVAT